MLIPEQEREANRTPKKENISTAGADEKAHNQALASFFAGWSRAWWQPSQQSCSGPSS